MLGWGIKDVVNERELSCSWDIKSSFTPREATVLSTEDTMMMGFIVSLGGVAKLLSTAREVAIVLSKVTHIL